MSAGESGLRRPSYLLGAQTHREVAPKRHRGRCGPGTRSPATDLAPAFELRAQPVELLAALEGGRVEGLRLPPSLRRVRRACGSHCLDPRSPPAASDGCLAIGCREENSSKGRGRGELAQREREREREGERESSCCY